MKRKIKEKVMAHFGEDKQAVFDTVVWCVIILCVVIAGVIGYKGSEPKKINGSDTKYAKEMVGKIVKDGFYSSADIINQMKKNGFDVKLDYNNTEIEVCYANKNSEKIIFSQNKDGVITSKVSNSETKRKQIGTAISYGLSGILIGVAVLVVISMLWIWYGSVIEFFKRRKKVVI